jgi:hypothetical protein
VVFASAQHESLVGLVCRVAFVALGLGGFVALVGLLQCTPGCQSCMQHTECCRVSKVWVCGVVWREKRGVAAHVEVGEGVGGGFLSI